MPEQRPRLRDNLGHTAYELYPLGQIPEEVIYNIAKWMIYYFAIGKSDISGEDWGDIFAKAVSGEHLNRPIGLADVVYEGMAWSVKSVKDNKPLETRKVRLISGRNSPEYSYGVTDPYIDIQDTGSKVLSIWNERVNIAKETYEPLRRCVLIRNCNKLEFTLFENDAVRYNISDYRWIVNDKRNFEGYLISSNTHCFTWQPHGSQFTIIDDVPSSAIRFKINRPPVIDFEKTIQEIGFDTSWLTFL